MMKCSPEACKVDSGERGGEAPLALNKELNTPLPLQTHIHYTALSSYSTHSTLKLALVYQVNHNYNTLIYYFVLYLADKADNNKNNIQQLILLL